jgi:hypothetical protein
MHIVKQVVTKSGSIFCSYIRSLFRHVRREYSSSLPLHCVQRLIPLLFLLCMATTSAAGVINVTRWGARPNDSGDDSVAIQRAIDAAPDGSTIYFPKGTYLVSNVAINYRHGLTLSGDGSTLTILRHHGRYASIFVSTGSTDMVVTKLGFDTNGVIAFGGFNFYNAKRITITKNHFFDSNRQPLAGADRYSWVFGRGTVPSEDLLISDNLIEDLQLEVNFSTRVRIEGNTIVRPVAAAGIGVFTVDDNTSARQYTIQKNTIVDPADCLGGIVVQLDPSTDNHSTMKTFRIVDNRIVYTKDITSDHASAIRIGTGNYRIATVGNVFDDIVIQNNITYKDPDSPYDFVAPIIFGNSSSIANFRFDNTQVSNNHIYYNNRFGRRIVDIRQKGVNYAESNNQVHNISSEMMPPSVPTALTATHISDSQIQLAWNPSVDNIGVDGYRVYRNGSRHGYSYGEYYVDTNLNPGVAYTYTVTAIDSSGTESSQSYAVTATTPVNTSVTTTTPVNTSVTTTTPVNTSNPVITPNPDPAPTETRPTLTVTPASIPGRGTLMASWSGIASPLSTARIALYQPGAANTSYIFWVYVSCSQTASSPRASGSCPLVFPASLRPGTYELRLFNQGYTALAISNRFTVTARLTVGPRNIPPGGTVTAAWNSTAPATSSDWIGLYRPGAPNTARIDWIYVSCSKTLGSPRASGSCPLVVPASLQSGGYELRLFTNGYTTLATSNRFDVVLEQTAAR